MPSHRSLLCVCALGLASFGNLSSSANSSPQNVRALLKSVDRTELRTDLVAKVVASPFREGMRFAKGDVLIAFDCERYKAELASAEASADAAAVELRRQARLQRHGAAAKSDVAKARSEVARTKAETKARVARMRDCVIVAPFSGRIGALHTRLHEMPGAGEPLMTLINDEKLEVEMLVPSNWLRWLETGGGFEVLVDETGTTHRAKVSRIGAEVDAVSQTVKVFGLIEANDRALLTGMSGVARFVVPGSDT